MPARKNQLSLDEILNGFTERIDRSTRRPNIYKFRALPQQELFLMSQAKGRILFGGNRGGKTYGGGADDVLAMTKRHPYRQHLYPDGPLRFRFIGVDFERGIDQGAIPLFQELIPPSFLKNGSWEDSYHKASHMLTLEDGTTCSFMSYEQDPNKFQIVSLHHTHFDEEPPKAIFKEDMLRHLDVAGTWTLSETPVQQLEWVQDELIDPTESGEATPYGRIEIFYLSTLENTNLPPDELAELVANMSAEEQIVRLQGRYPSGSQVFPEFQKKYPFVIPEEGFRLTPEHTVYESMDHGYVNPTSWNWTAVHPDGSIVTFKQLYSKGLVIESWAKAVLQMRKQICEQYGIPQWMFNEMSGGTFGDPAIADHGNASAQTGITIQQAYSMAGVYIATGGIRSVRAGNQNIGLDKFHTYLEMRPDKPGQPWWQITDNCTALIDEVKKARKPRQTAKNAEVLNASEKIRDKDNHAIDAQKYLWIITHDLRPPLYRGVNDKLDTQVADYFAGAAATQYDTHDQFFEATMSSHRDRFGSDSYAAMEE